MGAGTANDEESNDKEGAILVECSAEPFAFEASVALSCSSGFTTANSLLFTKEKLTTFGEVAKGVTRAPSVEWGEVAVLELEAEAVAEKRGPPAACANFA